MLSELFMALINAKNEKEKEAAYRRLENSGVDRMSANAVLAIILKDLREEQK